jgi:hypothetical protein
VASALPDVSVRLASSVKVAALLRRVASEGGFGTVLARGDPTAGSIAIVTREAGVETLLSPVNAMAGGYEWVAIATGDAVADIIARSRRHDPDLWVVELDIADAARLVAEILTGS